MSDQIADPLDLFLPPVRRWFRETLGEPTPAQRQGWPAIAAGQHTLILAPTGSGKTLAAFLACLDMLWRHEKPPPGVSVLYISPLKALNNDIHRNLQVPLAGVADVARQRNQPLPALEVAVRTGDTPAAERQRLIRKPPHVLITTPESLHLLLTSRARDTLRNVTHCIVDEIHALCPNKRGVFLSLLLERLQALQQGRDFVRIGLSATQRPLEEVARYLGGSEVTNEGQLVPRPVTIVDAGVRKNLDLLVVNPVEHFGALPEKTVWPSIYRLLREQIQQHRSTIVFANNRRSVERITVNLNGDVVGDDEASPHGTERPYLGTSSPTPLARAHHGSVSLEVRQATEQALKEGRLPAVVATASLELGIDMGAVDLVCQVESPGSVARGLQRVGRAGHLVGQRSKGRIIPKMPSDLIEAAAAARAMAAGEVEAIRVPINCLDVLAQQVVALAAMDTWDVPALYGLVRRAYPFRDLSPQAFETVLEMISGRYRWQPEDRSLRSLSALQPRVNWERVHNRLHALPGSQHLALVNGGTIPDTGQYAAYTHKGVRIGELDEEFIYERRVNDTFLLGTNAWRVDRIEADRVIVSPTEGAPAMAPFWRGENVGRTYDLGVAVGRFVREVTERLDKPDCLDWLEKEHLLDRAAARNVVGHVKRQLLVAGHVPTDRTLIVEASRDPLGDWQVIVLSPFGTRLHLALRLAIEGRLRQRLGYVPQCLHHDDGVLIRLLDCDEPILDLFDGLTAEGVESLIINELGDSALFALRFRQNAARALLVPRMRPGKRAPLWLQRLRSRDLLQVARRYPDFPIIAETFRECLHDHLDVPHLSELLSEIAAGRVQVVTRRAEAPSPFAASLLFSFTAAYMYQYDGSDADSGGTATLDRQLLDQLVAPDRQRHLLDPRAVHQVERRLRGIGQPPRTKAEMAEWLRRLGDATPAELEGPMTAFLNELEAEGIVEQLDLPRSALGPRWLLAEESKHYRQAFGLVPADASEAASAGEAILLRFLETHAMIGLQDVLVRYPFEPVWAERKLNEWANSGRLVAVRSQQAEMADAAAPVQWALPGNLEQTQRTTLALLRREVVTCPPQQYADFLIRWQKLHPETRQAREDCLIDVLERLEGMLLPAELWESQVLPGRVAGYQSRWLDDLVTAGDWTWACASESDDGAGTLSFWRRECLPHLATPEAMNLPALDGVAAQVLDILRTRGATFVGDLAQQTNATPSTVRAALWQLLRRGLVTNDRFDVIRRGEEGFATPKENGATERPRHPLLSRGRRRTPRRASQQHPEGRWSIIAYGQPDAERQAVFAATLLLRRYGIVARELAALDRRMPPWRVLYEVLSRMELAGQVRRGYFVEGLSGAQFAAPDAVRLLQDLHLPSTGGAPALLLHSLDPANLYGSGAPFDVPLLEGGTQSFLRRAGNWLVLRAGRPVLLIEQYGRRLTALASASADDLAAAVACLPGVLDRSGRAKMEVEEWNGAVVTSSAGRELLETTGFVRDYQGMTLYAAWRTPV